MDWGSRIGPGSTSQSRAIIAGNFIALVRHSSVCVCPSNEGMWAGETIRLLQSRLIRRRCTLRNDLAAQSQEQLLHAVAHGNSRNPSDIPVFLLIARCRPPSASNTGESQSNSLARKVGRPILSSSGASTCAAGGVFGCERFC